MGVTRLWDAGVSLVSGFWIPDLCHNLEDYLDALTDTMDTFRNTYRYMNNCNIHYSEFNDVR